MLGLIRKYYLGSVGGGIYLWQSKTDAEALYTDAWRTGIQERFGAVPEVTYFAVPVVVDNLTDEVVGG